MTAVGNSISSVAGRSTSATRSPPYAFSTAGSDSRWS